MIPGQGGFKPFRYCLYKRLKTGAYAALLVTFLLQASSCGDNLSPKAPGEPSGSGVLLMVLGTVQDAGSPQPGCEKDCCLPLYLHPDPGRKVVSLGVIDQIMHTRYLFEATPDIASQLKALGDADASGGGIFPSGIFLTHAHIGHYTGLMYLGKESANTRAVPVYAMPRMQAFLRENKPWEQLLADNNIVLEDLEDQKETILSSRFAVTPVLVPHRDEYSETVGYVLKGPKKKVLFIPDIDKWGQWGRSIVEEVAKVDYAFVDATFYDEDELPGRDMAAIPHPFVAESLKLFGDLPATEKSKIHFIHFNHTNPLLNPESQKSRDLLSLGFQIARVHDLFSL